VNKVELACEHPIIFRIVDFELAIWRNAREELASALVDVRLARYNSGWIGLRSVPVTMAEGCFIAIAIY